MSITLSNWVRVSDEIAVNTTYFCAAARPTTSFTMANTELASTHNGGVRNVTATTAGSGDSGKTVTLTGTDSDGAALTEIITLPGSATLTAGTELFKTVTAAEMSAQPAANVSVGFGTLCGQKIGGGGVFGSYRVTSGGTGGTVSFRTGGTDGTVIATDLTGGSAGTNGAMVSAYGTGAKLVNGFYVTYTVDVADQILAFYAG